jgi:hypothetical protein
MATLDDQPDSPVQITIMAAASSAAGTILARLIGGRRRDGGTVAATRGACSPLAD